MKVEIWSDIVCPFCYIGKRKFEKAMESFSDSINIEIEWKSFQLSPNMKTDPTKNINQFLAEHKGIPLEQATQMNDYVTNQASQVGLTYRFDQAVVANTFRAHQFLHFAKAYDKQTEAKELLMKSYFTEGKNIDDTSTLLAVAEQLDLNLEELQESLDSDTFNHAVKKDISEAQQLGIRGVPFFVFDRKYGVSGAQDPAVFLQTLQTSFSEWREENPDNSSQIIERAI